MACAARMSVTFRMNTTPGGSRANTTGRSCLRDRARQSHVPRRLECAVPAAYPCPAQTCRSPGSWWWVWPVAVSERARRGPQRPERMRLPVEVLGAEALSTLLVKKRPIIGSGGRNPTDAIGQELQFSYVLVLHSWPGLTVRRSVPPGVWHDRRTESAFHLRSRHLPP